MPDEPATPAGSPGNPSSNEAPAADTAGLPVATVFLKPKKARPFFGRHPWVLDSAVLRVEGSPQAGDVVDLATHDGNFVARGLFNPESRIRVRLYAFEAAVRLDDTFWRQRIERAIHLRKTLGLDDRNGAARLINSEGDDLSGLIVDRFGEWLCVQFTARAMHCRADLICDILEETVKPAGILLRSTERGLGKLEGLHITDGLVRGRSPNGPVFINEHGLRFGVDLSEGQKTGFYLDQRDNRQAAARFAGGRRVLDMFCYSGGFSIACAKAGAASVLAVDGSAKATALAEANAGLNSAACMTVETSDAFKKLDALAAAGDRFGMVILDPPKFARSRSTLDEALRAYHRVNRQGVDLLEPGGILVTCSCSGVVSREDFLMMLSGVAQRSGRSISILECRGAADDHPVSVSCLDGEYLTCVIASVV
ncbi:MAG: class I SAM-dependent rRNA methyltransferase [Pirellulales bacterium]|jgi:23S rRNA (cytosine1962-C5)-methyltransferase